MRSVGVSPARLPVPPSQRRSVALAWTIAVLAVLVVAHVVAWRQTDFALDALVRGWAGMADFIGSALPPDLSADVVSQGFKGCGTTLAIGLLGTTLSVPFSLALAILGSRTTSRLWLVYGLARVLMSFFRAVPDIVFALVFVTAVGLGPFAGVLAIICHNSGVMSKLWAEAMEEADDGPVQALRSAGASNLQIASHAVFPTVVPQLMGLLLYRFDVNVRSSLVLGLVGAGGIGFSINQAMSLFRFDEMMTYILMVLVLIVAVDLLSGLVRWQLSRP